MKSRWLWRVVSFAVVLCSFAPPALPQIVSGSITGSVTDPSGAVVAGASVTAVNTATGVESSTTTNPSGYFNIGNLIAGNYRVDVAATGFKALTRPDVQLQIGSIIDLEFRLEVGSVQEKMVITGEAPLLETAQVQVANTLGSQTLVALPTEGRNPTALALLSPGVVMNTYQEGIPSAEGAATTVSR